MSTTRSRSHRAAGRRNRKAALSASRKDRLWRRQHPSWPLQPTAQDWIDYYARDIEYCKLEARRIERAVAVYRAKCIAISGTAIVVAIWILTHIK